MNSDIFIKKLYSKKSLNNIEKKIYMLGSNSKVTLNKYLNNKLLFLVIIFLGLLFLSKIGYFLAPIVTLVLYFLYDYFLLDVPIKKRAKVLEHDSIFFFEVLALTLQSEKNLKLCLEVTSNSIDSELSLEVRNILKEIKLGKSLAEALEDLKNKCPSKTVNNVILNLIEANIYGNSIIDALNNQINYITDKRILEIKGQINKMPTKISILSVLFFIPLILILILAPVLLSYFIK